MVKRKREEPRLEVNLQKWDKELVRALKLAKGFERQRYAKRQREADAEKSTRLEKEIAVLKSLDLHQAARQHLCSSLLKIKGIAESPNLPEFIKPIPKPNLDEDARVALHNVTSALCNRKQVKDIIDEAIMGTCIALRVSMPEKKAKAKGKNDRRDQEQQANDDIKEKPPKSKESKKESSETREKTSEDKPSKKSKQVSGSENEEDVWEGFGSEGSAGTDEEENTFSRFAGMLGGSSDEESDGNASDEEDAEDSRATSIRGPSDYFSGSSAEEDSGGESGSDDDKEEESDYESEGSNAVSPPPKKVKSKSAKAVSTASGNSTFLPSLMGGYISGSESEASDIDIAAPAKKNRRGQRARQAIWEKKFKAQANHLKNQKSGRDQGWDMKRGAVGEEDSGPWKKGIRNPFEKRQQAPEGVHPDRHANFGDDKDRPKARNTNPRQRDNDRQRDTPRQGGWGQSKPAAPKEKPKPKKDNEGPLHASWEAAKKAKEAAQSVAFQGKKVVFD